MSYLSEQPTMISKTGMYAIRSMLALARVPEEEYAGVGRIAEAAEVPASYLSKLMQILARAGQVESQRGVGGGFRLARPATAVTLYDIIEPLEPIERWSGCFLGNSECSEERACPMHHRWKRVQQAYLTMLQETTLAELTDQSPDQIESLSQMVK